jgi:hypothetical protein
MTLAIVFFSAIFCIFVYGNQFSNNFFIPLQEPLKNMSVSPSIPWTNQKRSSILKNGLQVFLLEAPNAETWTLTDEYLQTNVPSFPTKTVVVVKFPIQYILATNLSFVGGVVGQSKPAFVIQNESGQSILFAKNLEENIFWQLKKNTLTLFKNENDQWIATNLPNSLTAEQASSYAEMAMQ